MKLKYQSLIGLVLVILLFGCQTQADRNAENLKQIKIGMSDKEVRSIMGKPDRIEIPPLVNDKYDLQYIAPTGYSDDFHIILSINDSSVISIGDGL